LYFRLQIHIYILHYILFFFLETLVLSLLHWNFNFYPNWRFKIRRILNWIDLSITFIGLNFTVNLSCPQIHGNHFISSFFFRLIWFILEHYTPLSWCVLWNITSNVYWQLRMLLKSSLQSCCGTLLKFIFYIFIQRILFHLEVFLFVILISHLGHNDAYWRFFIDY
jgi:hypothetical protein